MSAKRIKGDARKVVEWAVKRLGCTVEHGKKHGKLHVPGTQRVVVFGYTASCHRAAENFRHQVLRAAREAGLSV